MDILPQLTFIRQLADFYLNNKSVELITNISSLQRKVEEKKLYLAIVGEFSSGKSTFINALLRRRILKEAVKATTACATYIECSNRGFYLEVQFAQLKSIIRADERNILNLSTYLKTKYAITCYDIQQLIEILTSEQRVAKDVVALHLYIPDVNIPHNVVLIDTPGFNPGEDANQNHLDITRRVVSEVADAALILMPGYAPFSASIKRFMEENLNRYLHRCIFVVTRMDNVDEGEHPEIMNFVRSHLRNDFGLSDSRVYAESSISVLPVKKIPEYKREEWNNWKNRFLSFEAFLWKFIKRQKDVIVSEHHSYILLDIISSLKKDLLNKENILKEEVDVLSKDSITRIEVLTPKLIAKELNHINGNIVSLKSTVSSYMDSCERFCLSRADKVIKSGNVNQLEKEIFPQIIKDVENQVSNIVSEINRGYVGRLQSIINESINSVKQEFQNHYSMISSLNHVISLPQLQVSPIQFNKLSFSKALNEIKNIDSKELKEIGKGAAIGVGIGMLLGPAGAIVGGFLGAAFGGSGKDNTIQKKQIVKTVVNEQIHKFFADLKVDYSTSISKMQNSIIERFASFGNMHIKEYGNTVNALIDKKESEKKELYKQIDNLRNHISIIEDMSGKASKHLSHLKTIN